MGLQPDKRLGEATRIILYDKPYKSFLLLYNKMRLLSTLMRFIQTTSLKYKIDESHAVGHSMDVLYYAHEILQHEVLQHPYLKKQEAVIYTSALVHDMCDSKYMNPQEGITNINDILKYNLKPFEINAVDKIISTMSYSKVKKEGFPDLGEYQLAYHIVREADLLSAYDFDRSIIYHMYHSKTDFSTSFQNSMELFEHRVSKHEQHGLFVTEYSKAKGKELYEKSKKQIAAWKNVMTMYDMHV